MVLSSHPADLMIVSEVIPTFEEKIFSTVRIRSTDVTGQEGWYRKRMNLVAELGERNLRVRIWRRHRLGVRVLML